MTGLLDISREGHLGLIALNRPDAINALNLEMVAGITRTLELWHNDPGIRLVLFEGRGARGFCAGGDVRAVRQAIIDGRPGDADAFFAAEYQMNGMIATYPKPLVALTHGIVMGGGIGIAGHCRYRFTHADAKFAMPEAAIGFVADVGVNLVLGKAAVQRALLFLMSGLPVGPADALALGLADAVIDPTRNEAIRSGLAAAANAGTIDAALHALMRAEAIDPGQASLCLLADRLEPGLDWEDAESIVTGIAAAARTDPAFSLLSSTLASRSPTSLEAIVQSHLAARRLPAAVDVLALDLRLARLLSRLPDFAEGVRAVLVDKDQRPDWRPKTFADVPRHAIAATIPPISRSGS